MLWPHSSFYSTVYSLHFGILNIYSKFWSITFLLVSLLSSVLRGFCLPCIHNGRFFTIHGVLIIKTCLISYLVNGSKRSSSTKHDLAYDVQLCLYNKVCVNLFHYWMQIFLILEIRQKLFILHLFLGGDREGIMTFGWYISLLCPVFSLKDTKIETTITSMFTNHLSSDNYHTVVHVFML